MCFDELNFIGMSDYTSIFSNLFEKILANKPTVFFKKFYFFYEKQHTLVKKRKLKPSILEDL